VIDVDPLGFDTHGEQSVALGSEVLLVGGASGVPDKQRAHRAPPEKGSGHAAGGGRLGHRAVPNSTSKSLRDCDRKGDSLAQRECLC